MAVVQLRGRKLVAVLTSRFESLRMEATLMTKVKTHRHVLPLLFTEHDPLRGLSMVVPVARFGSVVDLADHLEFEGLNLTAAHAAVALMQVAYAVVHLDQQRIVHGDVAARNVLVHAYDAALPLAMHVVLADFGCALEGRMDPLCLRPLARELHALAR